MAIFIPAMLKANYQRHVLEFKRPSGTSRGVLTEKESWFITLHDGERTGIGECGLLRGLSVDNYAEYQQKLQWACDHIALGKDQLYSTLTAFPSIQFGLEQAFLSLQSHAPFVLFPSTFTSGEQQIPINGLVWMGARDFMRQQIKEKIEAGFDCIKLKIGAIDFQDELGLLHYIRQEFSPEEIEIRVDANGAFDPTNALEKLKQLSQFNLHSIEQPIKPRQWNQMAYLCDHSPLPIALDEELIGIFDVTKKQELLQTIQPQYIILKPSLIGGYQGSLDWIDLAEKQRIGWWITSALESNVGLNAIAQWTHTLNSKMPQGLGTGSLFTNNFESPLYVSNGTLGYDPQLTWNVNLEV